VYTPPYLPGVSETVDVRSVNVNKTCLTSAHLTVAKPLCNPGTYHLKYEPPTLC
jgi:hypothetical protein